MPDVAFYGDGEKPDWGDPEGTVLIDKHHAYRLFRRHGREDEGPIGAMVFHRREDGSWCGGGVRWTGDGPLWRLVSLEPLHVEPSIKCGDCADEFGDNGVSHGYIRDDAWVPAGEIPGWAA